MNCTAARPHLEAFADEELPAPVSGELELHLAECADCRGQVSLWRSVRRAARRSVDLTTVPSGVRGRIASHLARRARRDRLILLAGNSSVAAAALLLLAVVSWRYLDLAWGGPAYSPPPPPLAVGPERLVEVFSACAAPQIHDTLVASRSRREVLAGLSRSAGFDVLLPDLSAHGLQLVGGCTCSRIAGVQAVNAFYARGDVVIAVMSLDGRISIGNEDVPDCETRGRRRYERATADGVNLVKWNHGAGSYVACARIPLEELVKLTNSTAFDFMPGACSSGVRAASP